MSDSRTDPLGDASEVYDTAVYPEMSFSAIGDQGFALQSPDGVTGGVFVDEIWDGRVALAASSDVLEFGATAQLTATQAEQLGRALLRAAEYARDQEEVGPDAD